MRLIVLAVLLLAGCAAPSQPIYTQDGRMGHSINCPSVSIVQMNWSHCLAKAGEICGARGYDIISKVGEEGFSASYGRYGGGAETTHMRSLVVACKNV